MYDGLQEKYGFVPMNHQQPMFFPIRSVPVNDTAGGLVPGYQRIERADTGDTLAIHKSTYTLVPYERHFQAFERAITESDLRNEQVLVGTDMANNGAKIYRQYLFPDVKHVINARTKREIALRIAMFDSYDGSTRFMGKAGYFDFACANTAMLGLTLGEIAFRHVGDMDVKVEDAARLLTAAATEFPVVGTRCNSWTGVQLLAKQVEDLMRSFPQINDGLRDHIVASWAVEDDQSLWGVHQALTKWSSSEKSPKTRADREKRITTLVEGEQWQEFEKEIF